ncbi:hypothetical protein A2U01_0038626, partial [Trifolium medium]|nr:hypothetical protein [Trifolium medium]
MHKLVVEEPTQEEHARTFVVEEPTPAFVVEEQDDAPH